jgi:L-seryl-tRNA(Ser) seleniumtransferase
MSLESPYRRLGVAEVVNCVGHATRVGGSNPHPEVIEAMAAASAAYVEIDDLLAAGSRIIAQHTGAEAGLATSGASAALTLAAAACLARNDPDLMDRLPDTSACPRNEIIYPRLGPYDYDHAVRLSGARIVNVDYEADDALDRIAQAIGPKTAAVGFESRWAATRLEFAKLVAIAHEHALPVIVDASVALPPASNLRTFIAQGADLVAYSGGKHLGGPQASGFLCGRTSLVRSAWVQMVDMDARPGTWSLQGWVDEGWITRPPRHGIGRSMKIGKETIVGLLVALERYAQRDHAREESEWQRVADNLGVALAAIPELQVQTVHPRPGERAYSRVRIESGAPPGGMSVRHLIDELRRLPRKIILSEDETSPDRAYLYTNCLEPADVLYLLLKFHEIAARHRRGG